MSFGVDYAWEHPSISALVAAGVKFVCRYLSNDTGKNLTLAEATVLSNAGISCVAVWESTAKRMLAGQSAGITDAKKALSQATACGMPNGTPIYFAADWDASSSQQAAINAYLDGVASIIGLQCTGIYGGYGPVSRAFNAGKVTYGWQTYAWSSGAWDGRAQIQQYSNDHNLGGVSLDYDRSMADYFGQWKVGEIPMTISNADIKAIWTTDDIVANPNPDDPNKYWGPGYHLTNIGQHVRSLEIAVAALQDNMNTLLGKSSGVDEAAIVSGVLAGLNPQAMADSIATALGPDVAKDVLDALKARLES